MMVLINIQYPSSFQNHTHGHTVSDNPTVQSTGASGRVETCKYKNGFSNLRTLMALKVYPTGTIDAIS